MRRSHSFVFAAVVLTAACARPVAVQSDPAATYAVQVGNATTAALRVSFDAGAGERELGSVAAGGSERFVIVNPGAPSVTLVGVGPGFTVRQAVTLRAGETVRVTLRR